MSTLLSINNYYYRRGGAEVVFLEQNRMFEASGWEVVPFAMQHPKNLESPWSPYFVDEIEFGEAYSVWEKLLKVPKVIYSLEARRKIGKLVNDARPDIAHAHNVYHHMSPSIFSVLKRHRIPTILTLHDLKLACPAYKMLTHDGICERCKNGALLHVVRNRCVKNSLALSSMIWLEASVQRMLGCYTDNVDRFITPSRFYLEKMVEWGWQRNRFTYIPNFVDVASHHPDFNAGQAFLYFGRLAPEKGLATLIKAATQAQVPLWIVGTGPEEIALKQLAASLSANVAFLGYKTGEELHELVRRARAVVLPSEWYENAPMSVLESYALGRIVIGAAIGGIPELIRENQTGISFESGNVEALTAALRNVATMSGAQLAEMGRAARTWVENDFTVTRYLERVLDLYREFGVGDLTNKSAR
ncbi:MAG: glycosyltransferase family 4 protein [Gammaproteobacteria bacterium]